jgi:hypothetical protein
MRAREADGHMYRPSFARRAGISVASLLKLETGKPVGPTVYEAVARALSSWTEGTPRHILDGGEPPSHAAQAVTTERAEPAEDDRFQQARKKVIGLAGIFSEDRILGMLSYIDNVEQQQRQQSVADDQRRAI